MIKSAIILAAGFGSRLMPLTKDRPKCLVPVGGTPIVFRTLDILEQLGVDEAIMVLGHKEEAVREALGNKRGSVSIRYIINEEYGITNTMYSLLLAGETMRQGAYIIEGDCVLSEDVLNTLVKATPADRSFWVVDDWNERSSGCRLTTSGEGTRITGQDIIRELNTRFTEGVHHKSVGLLRLNADQGRLMEEKLQEEANKDNRKVYYDDVFGMNAELFQIHALNIHPMRWMEVDDAADLAIAEEIFGSGNEQ